VTPTASEHPPAHGDEPTERELLDELASLRDEPAASDPRERAEVAARTAATYLARRRQRLRRELRGG
jgi:hypothetical protein